ncbi:hypothetical protein AVEN_119061-1 [Araneus ventricosus]|uniref:Uncharacterized protein n=1 Tax=Araneus ventricosus TaxID=182803 RepID=A0A4Y2BM30_ARAVE|nr:hypothetical protein AVEN_119061-1 [Araneus ventricosus]
MSYPCLVNDRFDDPDAHDRMLAYLRACRIVIAVWILAVSYWNNSSTLHWTASQGLNQYSDVSLCIQKHRNINKRDLTVIPNPSFNYNTRRLHAPFK